MPHNNLNMHYYQKEDGYTEVVDIAEIQCLVGHVFNQGWWTIIVHSWKLAHAKAVED